MKTGMIGYGMAKAAVHQLTKSLAAKDSGLPEDSLVAAILPVTLDTPMNRKWMPKADTTTWTSMDFISEFVTFIYLIFFLFQAFYQFVLLFNFLIDYFGSGHRKKNVRKMAVFFS